MGRPGGGADGGAGGGGGAAGGGNGGAGGSGVVMLRYPKQYTLVPGASHVSTTITQGANKVTILEQLTEKPISEKKVKADLVEEFSKYDKDLRILTYKVMLEKFNGKYSNLNKGQKGILKEFINSIDNTPRLKEIYNTKINEVKKVLNHQIKSVKDEATKIKLTEVVKLLKELDKSSKINNDDLINLLQYYQLTEELHKTSK